MAAEYLDKAGLTQLVKLIKNRVQPVDKGGTGVTTEKAIALKAYPVGSVYMSWNSTSPASLFGGTWTPIVGRFPYFNAGTSTGGSNTHTLTVNEMPSHSHEIRWSYAVGNTGHIPLGGEFGIQSQGEIQKTGGGAAHNNMPAYQTLYAWRRTA